MRHFLNTTINAYSDITYGHVAIGIVIALAVISYVVYQVVKAERKIKFVKS